MPNLDNAWRWVRYEPDLGGNRSLPEAQRFYLEVASGLSKLELQRLFEQLGEKAKALAAPSDVDAEERTTGFATELAASIGAYARMGKEPLTVNGAEVKTLADYLGVAVRQTGQVLVSELFAAVRTANSWEGAQELFSARHSGGFTFTGDPSAELENVPTVGR